MSHQDLERIIDAAFDDRANIGLATRGAVRDAVDAALNLLDSGKARVAEKTGLERTHLYRKLKQLGVDLSRGKRGAGG